MIYCNNINMDNHYSIHIDLEDGTFSHQLMLKGKYSTKKYPLGTTRKQIVAQLDKLFVQEEAEKYVFTNE